MKTISHIIATTAILLLVSCSNGVSSKILKLAKPTETVAPTTVVIERKVTEAGQSATRANNEVVSAKKEVTELEDRLAEGKVINAEFAEAIKGLAEEHQEKMRLFNTRFSDLATRSKETITRISKNLEGATAQLNVLKIQLAEAEQEIVKNKADGEKVQGELKFYRESYEAVTKAAEDDEKYRDKAESLKKYFWFFWLSITLFILYVLFTIFKRRFI